MSQMTLDERTDHIAVSISAFRAGHIGPTRFRALLAIAGLNATEIDALLVENNGANTEALRHAR